MYSSRRSRLSIALFFCAIATPALPALAPDEAHVHIRFAPTTADFPNPDRGFYAWSGSDFISAFDLDSLHAGYASGMRLVMATVPLGSYRHTELPAAFLSTLSSRFAAVRASGMKAILLFAYDFSAEGRDASAAQIQRHLQQLRPVLAANADVIPFMRAGFIGAWGEWHSSQAGHSCGYRSGRTPCATADASREAVRDALLANVPATTQISFRYPADLQRWYPRGNAPARVGAHNDCFLAGPTDAGTYTADAQRPFVRALSQRAAFGGETCEDTDAIVRKDCSDILSEGAQYHLAWLNSSYAPSVLNAWKREGCYSEVSRSMGYRLQLDALSHESSAAQGDRLSFQVDLHNVGWARMFTPRKLVVTLRHKASGLRIAAEAGDLSDLPPQAQAATRITVTINIPASAQAGEYTVLLSAPDTFPRLAADARYAVRFANADRPTATQVWEAATASMAAGSSVWITAQAAARQAAAP